VPGNIKHATREEEGRFLADNYPECGTRVEITDQEKNNRDAKSGA
jgi:hypothetical protein